MSSSAVVAVEDQTKADPALAESSSAAHGGAAAPLSPLSGAYLLVVLGEPISEEHKGTMLQKLGQGELVHDDVCMYA